jgi:hypothetical protein
MGLICQANIPFAHRWLSYQPEEGSMEDREKMLNGRMQMVYGQFSESKRRLDYFMMGICVAGIGFAIQVGINQPLGYEHIPWGIGVLCIGVSFFLGWMLLASITGLLAANTGYLQTTLDMERTEDGPAKKDLAKKAEEVRKEVDDANERIRKMGKIQVITFFVGLGFIMAWCLGHMYLLRHSS